MTIANDSHNCASIYFQVTFILPSPSSLLKLPIYFRRKRTTTTSKTRFSFGSTSHYREFKKPLWRQLQRKRDIKIELCLKLSPLRLFHVDHVIQNRRTALSPSWYEWFSYKGKEWKIYCCELPLSSEPQIWKYHVVVWQTTSKHCTKKRAARAARLFFFTQPIKSLICGVVVDVAVVRS